MDKGLFDNFKLKEFILVLLETSLKILDEKGNNLDYLFKILENTDSCSK